jgi:hypothetical protein
MQQHGGHQRPGPVDTFPTDIEGLPAASAPRQLELSDGDTLTLTIAPVAKRLDATTVRMLAYNGSVPGPTVRVRQGLEIVVQVTKATPAHTTTSPLADMTTTTQLTPTPAGAVLVGRDLRTNTDDGRARTHAAADAGRHAVAPPRVQPPRTPCAVSRIRVGPPPSEGCLGPHADEQRQTEVGADRFPRRPPRVAGPALCSRQSTRAALMTRRPPELIVIRLGHAGASNGCPVSGRHRNRTGTGNGEYGRIDSPAAEVARWGRQNARF